MGAAYEDKSLCNQKRENTFYVLKKIFDVYIIMRIFSYLKKKKQTNKPLKLSQSFLGTHVKAEI